MTFAQDFLKQAQDRLYTQLEPVPPVHLIYAVAHATDGDVVLGYATYRVDEDTSVTYRHVWVTADAIGVVKATGPETWNGRYDRAGDGDVEIQTTLRRRSEIEKVTLSGYRLIRDSFGDRISSVEVDVTVEFRIGDPVSIPGSVRNEIEREAIQNLQRVLVHGA